MREYTVEKGLYRDCFLLSWYSPSVLFV